jgi:peptide/nickel transport system substrate-binding protein
VISRRLLLGSAAAALGASLTCARSASALGRTRLGGKFAFSVPFAIRSLDPHDFSDPLAALFGHALFDSLYVHDKRGLTLGLAEALPEREGTAVVVRLRGGLRTANGKALDARDVVASLKRARGRGAAAWLDPLGAPAVSSKDALAVVFPKASPSSALLALSSPLLAIVPRDFDARAPDGTGAFGATLKDKQLTLTRNANAAMGPAFLESLTVREAADLRDSLRDFEVGRGDLGWLGTGLFSGRPEAEKFDHGAVASFVLVSGATGPLPKPGELQKVVDSIPRAALAHLGLGPLPAGSAAAAYAGPPVELWVEPSAHLVEIADAIATALSAKDHEITVKQGARSDIAARRHRGEAFLSLHAIRPLGTQALPATAHVALIEDPSRTTLATTGASPRDATGSTRVAVVGELRVAGGKTPDLVLSAHARGGWDLASSRLKRK